MPQQPMKGCRRRERSQPQTHALALQLDFHTLALQDEVRMLVDERGGPDAMTAMDWQAGALPGWLLQHSPEPQYSEYRVVYDYDMPRNVRLLATRQHNPESVWTLAVPFHRPIHQFSPPRMHLGTHTCTHLLIRTHARHWAHSHSYACTYMYARP